MGRLDHLLGLDDERERTARASIWKRALWRAFKRLVRDQPKAVAYAALQAIGYATRQSASEAVDVIGEKLPVPSARPDRRTEHRAREIAETVAPEDLKRLAKLAPRSPGDT
jgi:hypothetical protein